MLSRKKGNCSVCGKENVILGRIYPKECFTCYTYNKKKQYYDKKKNYKIKTLKPKIKYRSLKESVRIKEYSKLRDNYLINNPICEVENCFNKSTNIHHKGGRLGKLLTYVSWFMACCSNCHPNRIHFKDNKWAKEKGYLKTGVDIDNKLKELNGIF